MTHSLVQLFFMPVHLGVERSLVKRKQEVETFTPINDAEEWATPLYLYLSVKANIQTRNLWTKSKKKDIVRSIN